MRKLIALLLLAVTLLTFSACSKKSEYPFACDKGTVSIGLYNYYLDKVISSPEDYSAKKDDRESIANAAKSLCLEYLAAIKLMEKEGIVLKSEFKRIAADNTENLWGLFSSYYKSIGVTKPDITMAQTHESRLLELLDHFYGAGGKNPVSEADLKEKFVDIYVGFKAIEGSLTRVNDKGETVELTKKELQETQKLFNKMAERINNGSATIDELNIQYNDSLDIIVTAPLSVLITKKGDPMYDGEFFNRVASVPHGKAKVIKSGSSIYVIERQTIATEDEDAFMNYRSEILQKMRMPKIREKISNTVKELSVTENTKLIDKAIKEKLKEKK